MLSPEELHEIDHEISKVPVRQSASLEALMVVQRARGYVSDEALADVADYLHMSRAELDSIATFYNLIYRKPVGKHVIRLCDSVSCWLLGYENVRAGIKEELSIDFGQTTSDNNFTLLPTQCLGTCDKGPAMLIDDELYQHVSKESISNTLREHCNARKHKSHKTVEHKSCSIEGA